MTAVRVGAPVDKAFVSSRVVLDGGIRPAAVLVKDGTIVDVVAPGERPLGVDVIDVLDDVLLPGLVDSHVHVNEPGRTAWEGFATATQAAARGGISALVDMPLNSIPPTTTVAALEEKMEAARGQCAIDVGFWGGVVPGNAGELLALVKRGVFGFKCFLIDSGVAEFQHVAERDLERALGLLREAGVPLLTHAELQGPIDAHAPALEAAALPHTSYRYHLESRPRAAEDEAIALMVRLCRAHETPVHIVHHSSSSALPALAAAREEGLPLTVETCPHYLTFSAEEIPDGATWFKCTPPIRERENNDRLWGALAAGVLDAVVSDHSPCSVALKQIEAGDFDAAWGGISSLQLTLPATWTGARARGRTLVDVVRWMSEAPARLAGLAQKGALAPGKDADLVAFDPDARFVVDETALSHKNKLSPYHGRALTGVVRGTWLRGERVFSAGSHRSDDVTLRNGRLLLRGTA
jgi:allantoinase